MPKAKKEIVLTHTEVLCLAITEANRRWMEETSHIHDAESVAPDFAAELRDSAVWRKKLQILLDLYKLETGSDYGLEIETSEE